MTEITQADYDVTDYIVGRSAREVDYQVVARHREQAEQETVAKIVAWLRDQNQLRVAPMAIATAIEAGEWK